MPTDINNCDHTFIIYKSLPGMQSHVNWCSKCGKVRTREDVVGETSDANTLVHESLSTTSRNNLLSKRPL